MKPFTLVLLYFLGIVIMVYLFMVIPGKKRNKQMRALHDSVQEGDEIVTIGGIIATVMSRDGERLTLKIDEAGTSMKVMIFAVQKVLKPHEDAEKQQPR